MSGHSLIEISLSALDDEMTPSVVNLFDRWGRGGAVVEQAFGQDAGSTVKAFLLSEDDDRLRSIQIGLELLRRARDFSSNQDAPKGEEQALSGRLPEPRIRFLAETDWAEAWKSSYDVLRIGQRLVVKPTWRDYSPEAGELLIELDPGMAFGSGLHPTTRLCLEAMEDYLRPPATVLDVGTGSGILAIAAARLGASRVLALDTDPLAVRVARENVALNQVESIVRVEVGTTQTPYLPDQPGRASEARSSNLVVANILAETIIELAPALASSLSPEGILVASGIILARTELVISSLRKNGLSILARRNLGEWVALIARKGQVAQDSNLQLELSSPVSSCRT